jgi:Collagen triple helix repeat (20 copies)
MTHIEIALIANTLPTTKNTCRTGPFEGFFVGSAEFCKFKFDDRKDNNRTGTQGQPGPLGPPGPEGPQGLTGATGLQGIQGPKGDTGATGQNGGTGQQGPPGIIFVNGTNVYLNQTMRTVGAGTGNIAGNALCDDGDFVLNGGYFINSADPDYGLNYNRPTTGIPPIFFTSAPAGAGWEVAIQGINSGFGTTLTISAFCIDNPPLRP